MRNSLLPSSILDDLKIEHATVRHVSAVHGGDSGAAYRLETTAATLFIKTAPAADVARLKAERNGLERIAQCRAVRVPVVAAIGALAQVSYLAMEWLALKPATPAGAARLGRRLARLHRSAGERFGWDKDNFIGPSVQRNTPCDRWCDFYVTQRLGSQAELARAGAATRALYAPLRRLMPVAREQLAGHQPLPSLLHGDLWSGNWGVVDDDEPVIFDPAAYFGDRETDLAMTRLFGGFPEAFYRAYEEVWPLPDDHHLRMELYQLYHLVNHANLFGGRYLDQALDSIVRCLR